MGDQQVEGPGDRQAAEEPPRVGGDRVLGLLGDVDRVLEPDQGVEGERGAGDNTANTLVPSLNSNARPGSASPWPIATAAITANQQQPGDLDHGETDVHLHRLRDPTQVEQGDRDEQEEGAEHNLQVDELGQVVAAEKPRAQALADDPDMITW